MDDILTIFKDFGRVICGREVAESFDVKNHGNDHVTLTVVDHKDDDDNSFTITPKTAKVAAKKTCRFAVKFTSHVPDVVYKKECSITNGSRTVAELTLSCVSVGPSVRPRRCNVKFFLLRNVSVNSRKLEVENQSPCPAKFQFEHLGKVAPFEICQGSGAIQPNGKVIFDVRFNPSQPGMYHKKVYCLFQYHPPLLLVLTGIYNPKLKIDPSKLRLQPPLQEEVSDNYQDYMANVNETYEMEPVDPCLEISSPTRTVVRFADCEEESENDEITLTSGDSQQEASLSPTNEVDRAGLTTYFISVGSCSSLSGGVSLVNVSKEKEFRFDWSNENGRHFSVLPKTGNLKGNQHLNLDIQFSPDAKDMLYEGQLDVRLFQDENDCQRSKEEILLPMTMTLSIIGHSFCPNSDGWLEQCVVEPRELNLPACVPGRVVYATLAMKRDGHLPVTYQFIRPEESYMKIKPPLGYISDRYQLFVVQFDASGKSEGKYTETWKIAYNSTTKYFGAIIISALVQEPKVILGEGNTVKFVVTLPGGASKSTLPIRNPTKLKLQYEFFIPKHITWIEVPVLKGELDPLTTSYMDIVFKPTKVDEYLDYICCCSRPVRTPDYTATTTITLQGSCQDGFLVATPSTHDFGRCLHGTEQKKVFHVFNFTPILINFELSVVDDEFLSDVVEDVVKINPERGSVQGKSNITVEVSVTPMSSAWRRYSLRCRSLTSEKADPLPCSDPRTLLTFQIEGILPTFQIIDLNVEGGGPLISPDWLWKMMDINGLNRILRHIRPDEEATLDVRVPEASVNSSPVIIYLLLEAKNLFEMSLEIRKVHWSHTRSRIHWMTESARDSSNFMTLAPLKMTLQPSCREILKLAFTYEATGSTQYNWTLLLSQSRAINLKMSVNGLIAEEIAQTSAYLAPDIRFKPTFIGDMAPPLQLYWLYNNTPSSTAYVLDKTALREGTPPFEKIFDCLNPNGVLPPYSSLPVVFKFVPNELKGYQAQCTLCLHTDCRLNLTLTGSGILNYSYIGEFSHEPTIPESPILNQTYIGLEPSIRVFTVKPFVTFSNVERIFFLKNTSQSKVWAFQWHLFYVKNLIKARIEPNQGKIQPGKELLMRLYIESYQYPTNLCFSIPCDVTDYTALEAYEAALQLKDQIAEKYKDYFTITEKGTFNEIPEVDVPEKPEKCHIFVTVRTNIVAEEEVENKLYPDAVLRLKSGREIADPVREQQIWDRESERVVNSVMEKLIWKILHSRNFRRQLSKYQELYGNPTYRQLFPGSEKATTCNQKRLSTTLSRNHVQSILQNMIFDVLRRRFNEPH